MAQVAPIMRTPLADEESLPPKPNATYKDELGPCRIRATKCHTEIARSLDSPPLERPNTGSGYHPLIHVTGTHVPQPVLLPTASGIGRCGCSTRKAQRGHEEDALTSAPDKKHTPEPLAKRQQQMLAVTIPAVGLLLINGPLWVLNMMPTDEAKLITISILVCSFVALLGIGAGAKPCDSLAAGAAYAAVLVVFLQSVKQGE